MKILSFEMKIFFVSSSVKFDSLIFWVWNIIQILSLYLYSYLISNLERTYEPRKDLWTSDLASLNCQIWSPLSLEISSRIHDLPQ